jgi:hypothetical protein
MSNAGYILAPTTRTVETKRLFGPEAMRSEALRRETGTPSINRAEAASFGAALQRLEAGTDQRPANDRATPAAGTPNSVFLARTLRKA